MSQLEEHYWSSDDESVASSAGVPELGVDVVTSGSVSSRSKRGSRLFSQGTMRSMDQARTILLHLNRSHQERSSLQITRGAVASNVAKTDRGFLNVKVKGKVGLAKRKWIVLSGYKLLIFDKGGDAEPRNTLDLAHSMLHVPLDGSKKCAYDLYSVHESGEKVAFSFAAENLADMQSWVAAIQDGIDEARMILQAALMFRNTQSNRQGYSLVQLKSSGFELRWIALETGRLYMFSHCNATRPLDTLDLSQSHVSLPDDYQALLSLEVVTPFETAVLAFSSINEVLLWVVAVRHVINTLSGVLAAPTTGFHQGQLCKLGRKAWKASKPGWFILQDGVLKRYAKIKGAHKDGPPDPSTYALQQPERMIDLWGTAVHERVRDPTQIVLKKANKLYTFVAPSPQEATAWTESLKAAIQYAKTARAVSIREGFLYKIPKPSFMQESKYRWCVLTRTALSYYRGPQDPDCIDSFDLRTISIMEPLSSDDDFSFDMVTPKKTFQMVASSKEDQKEWIKQLKLAIREASRTDAIRLRSGKKFHRQPRSVSCPPVVQRLEVGFLEDQAQRSAVRRKRQESVSNMTGEVWVETNLGGGSIRSETSDVPSTGANKSATTGSSKMGSVREDGADAAAGDDAPAREYEDDEVHMTKTTRSKDSLDYNMVSDQVMDPSEARRRDSLPLDMSTVRVSTLAADSSSVLVIDNGSAFIKAGLSGERLPSTVFPSSPSFVQNPGAEDFGMFRNDSPLNTRGVGEPDYDLMIPIWDHVYDAMGIASTDHSALMTEPIGLTRKGRERIAEIFFEEFGVPSLSLQNQGILTLASAGLTTGVALSWGNMLHITAVSNGYILPQSVVQINFGGDDLTELMDTLLRNEHGVTLGKRSSLVRRMKEEMCYVAENFEAAVASVSSKSAVPYQLNDRKITINAERFICPEALFDPGLLQLECDGIHKLVADSVGKCAVDLRKDLYANILLSGSNTLFTGFPKRLSRELKQLAPSGASINVLVPKNRKYTAWIGGSRVAGRPDYPEQCVWAEDFAEYGANVL